MEKIFEILFSNATKLQFTESSEALQKDVNCNKSKEHFLTAIRTLELMQVGCKPGWNKKEYVAF